jgi:pimeloyl-ACP methyl ester carboxylesterase
MPYEQQITINSGNGSALQAVVCGAPQGGACVVMCYPLFEERKHAQRAYVAVARALAGRSIASIRFDYYACGNSQGRFSEATLSRWISDTVAVFEAAAVMRSRRIMAVGLRLGANVALAAARVNDLCQDLLLWNHVRDTRRYLAHEFRRNCIRNMLYSARGPQGFSTQADSEVCDIAGYPAGRRLIAELQSGMPTDLTALPWDKRIYLGTVAASEARGIDAESSAIRGALRACGDSFWNAPNASDFGDFVMRTVEHFAQRAT